jgi:hypothetical protein
VVHRVVAVVCDAIGVHRNGTMSPIYFISNPFHVRLN